MQEAPYVFAMGMGGWTFSSDIVALKDQINVTELSSMLSGGVTPHDEADNVMEWLIAISWQHHCGTAQAESYALLMSLGSH